MKAKNSTKKSKSSRTPLATASAVRLEIHEPTAATVCVAGSFNDWHPSDAPMVRQSDGLWAKEVMLPPGRYEYLFVVDGQWRPDPSATEQSGNPFGGVNSVLNIQG